MSRSLAVVLVFSAVILAGLALWPPSLTDWDSWEYTFLAVNGEPSGLALRRWWFIFLMRVIHLATAGMGATGLEPFVPLKAAVLLMTALGVVATMGWAGRLTRRPSAAIAAGVIGVLSPGLLIYGTTVMTEGPTILALALAFLAWELALGHARERPSRALAWSLGAGFVFGMAISMREPALWLGAWPLASCHIDRPRRRWLLLAAAACAAVLSLAIAVLMAWHWSGVGPLESLDGYSRYMTAERAAFGYSGLRNLGYLASHTVLVAPLATLLLLGAVFRRAVVRPSPSPERARVTRRLRWLLVSTLPYLAFTWWNPDLVFNYRLLIPFGFVLTPVAGDVAASAVVRVAAALGPSSRIRTTVIGAATAIGAAAAVLVSGSQLYPYHVRWQEHQDRMYDSLRALPDAPVTVVTGPGLIIGRYLKETGVRPRLRLHGLDPLEKRWTEEDVRRLIEADLAEGRRVFVNLDEYAWTRAHDEPHEWNAVTGAAEGFRRGEVREPFVEMVAP